MAKSSPIKYSQTTLFGDFANVPEAPAHIDLNSYNHIIVATSGGKDSIACILHLLEEGVLSHKIELWHHLIDGREGSTLMDWPVTESYCEKFARAFGIRLYYSWKQGGFEGEMLRENARTAPLTFQVPDPVDADNIIECSMGGTRGKMGTRRRFPQVTADLRTRWCSAYLKIDVCTQAINNQLRFINKRTLVVTGERVQESAARSKYKVFEPDRSDNRNGKRVVRHVDHWRPVHAWDEKEVWDIIKRHNVMPHPAYRLGWNRLSCISCIFGSPNQWASLHQIDPARFKKIGDYEKEFDCTINRKYSVWEQIAKGSPYPDMAPSLVREGLSRTYASPIRAKDGCWRLLAGAFGENVGPC